MTWHPDRAVRLDCPETYGTHKCSQLNGHEDFHYCVCVDGGTMRWKTGARAPLSAYNPKLLQAHHILQLRKSGLIS